MSAKIRTAEIRKEYEELDKTNPSNGNKHIIATGYYIERIITDFKIEKIVTKYTFLEYKDKNTGDIFFAKHPDVPDVGIFGKNIIAMANLLHFEYRVTLAGVADFFTNVADISMTPPQFLNYAAGRQTSLSQNIRI